MRTNLNVPYSDNATAKRLGARWDAESKTWYVKDVANLRPFMRWMPAHLLKPTDAKPAVSSKKNPHEQSQPKSLTKRGKTIIGKDYHHVECKCDRPPWEPCDNCADSK